MTEYKYLGVWIDTSAKYGINIIKKKDKIPYMISNIKRIANSNTMGKLSIEARLKMIDTILVPSLIYNAEAYPTHTREEMRQLEALQGKMLREMVNVPSSTPYLPLLLETGMWTMEARLNYKKLMLFHNIMNSPEDRVIKKIIIEQQNNTRSGTWYHTIKTIQTKYNIRETHEAKKSKWKKHVKERIRNTMEEELREGCKQISKGRSVANDRHTMKTYLNDVSIDEASSIIKMRLHMVNLPCNYGLGENGCWLCGRSGKIKTEHYFECTAASLLRDCWGIREDPTLLSTQEKK